MKLRYFIPFLVLVVAFSFIVYGCKLEEKSVAEKGEKVSICDLTKEKTDQYFQITGTILFVDTNDPEGIFSEVSDKSCSIAVWIDEKMWNSWDSETKSLYNEGNQVALNGLLLLIGNELMFELSSPPIIEREAAEEGEKVSEEVSICDLTKEKTDQYFQITGTILFVDTNDPEGIFSEVSDKSCSIAVWIDEKMWNSWDSETKSLYNEGNQVALNGLLLLIGNELMFELSSPPINREADEDLGDFDLILNPNDTSSYQISNFKHVDYNYYNDDAGYPIWSAGICFVGILTSILSYHNSNIDTNLISGLTAFGFGGPLYYSQYFYPHDTMSPAVELDHILYAAKVLGFEAALLDITSQDDALKVLKTAVNNDLPVFLGQDWNFALDEYAAQSPMYELSKELGMVNYGTHFIALIGYDEAQKIYYIEDANDIMPYSLRTLSEEALLKSWEKGREVEFVTSPIGLGEYPKDPYTLLIFFPTDKKIDLKDAHFAALTNASQMIYISNEIWADVQADVFGDLETMDIGEISDAFFQQFAEWPIDFKFGAAFLRQTGTYWGEDVEVELEKAAKLYDENYALLDSFIKNEIDNVSGESLAGLLENIMTNQETVAGLIENAINEIFNTEPENDFVEWNTQEKMKALRDRAYENGNKVKDQAL